MCCFCCKQCHTDTIGHCIRNAQFVCYLLDNLQKTRIGITVNSFRKTASDDEISSLAKALIRMWKKLVPGE